MFLIMVQLIMLMVFISHWCFRIPISGPHIPLVVPRPNSWDVLSGHISDPYWGSPGVVSFSIPINNPPLVFSLKCDSIDVPIISSDIILTHSWKSFLIMHKWYIEDQSCQDKDGCI